MTSVSERMNAHGGDALISASHVGASQSGPAVGAEASAAPLIFRNRDFK
jgi:hypothetical protein